MVSLTSKVAVLIGQSLEDRAVAEVVSDDLRFSGRSGLCPPDARWPGLSRPPTPYFVARKTEDVGTRHKAGHDDREIVR
jgi:hypothetical protein